MVPKAHHSLTEYAHMRSIMINFFTGITGRIRGHTATVESKQEGATYDNQTLHTVMHGVQGQMDNYGQMGEKVSDADRTKSWGVPALSGNIVENQPEHVMLDEERVVGRLENKVLHEGLRNVLVRLKLAKNVDEDSAVKHWLAVHRRDQVGNFLEGE